MHKLQREPVVATMNATGERVLRDTQAAIDRRELGDVFTLSGHPTWSFLQFKDARGATMWEIKTLFMQEMLKRGVLTYGTHNISYAHSSTDLDQLATAYDETFDVIKRGLESGSSGVKSLLECKVLEPLFRVR
jgi:glutamate-1-semialdehyde 2,1-aminomutase